MMSETLAVEAVRVLVPLTPDVTGLVEMAVRWALGTMDSPSAEQVRVLACPDWPALLERAREEASPDDRDRIVLLTTFDPLELWDVAAGRIRVCVGLRECEESLGCALAEAWVGGCYWSAAVHDGIEQVTAEPADRIARGRSLEMRLTPDQRATASLAAQGMQTKEIAHRLELSERTVKRHLRAVCDEVGAGRRDLADAIARMELDDMRSGGGDSEEAGGAPEAGARIHVITSGKPPAPSGTAAPGAE